MYVCIQPFTYVGRVRCLSLLLGFSSDETNKNLVRNKKQKQIVTEAEDFGDSLHIILEGLLEYAVKVLYLVKRELGNLVANYHTYTAGLFCCMYLDTCRKG